MTNLVGPRLLQPRPMNLFFGVETQGKTEMRICPLARIYFRASDGFGSEKTEERNGGFHSHGGTTKNHPLIDGILTRTIQRPWGPPMTTIDSMGDPKQFRTQPLLSYRSWFGKSRFLRWKTYRTLSFQEYAQGWWWATAISWKYRWIFLNQVYIMEIYG